MGASDKSKFKPKKSINNSVKARSNFSVPINVCLRYGSSPYPKGFKCPATGSTCNYCKKLGHFSKVCLKKFQKKTVACVLESEDDSGSESIFVVAEDTFKAQMICL